MSVGRFLQQGAAGNAGGAVYVDDVFSTYLYTGDDTDNRTIENGIDLAGEGGMVWIKARKLGNESAIPHVIADTESAGSGANPYQGASNSSNAYYTASNQFRGFTNNGFIVSSGNETNGSGSVGYEKTYASWTFRKQPGFFDVVTYTGNGTNRTINHNLGSTPGMIIIKCTSGAFAWAVWHRGINTDSRQYLWLQSTQAVASRSDYWNTSDPTDSSFPLGTNGTVNSNGQTYVAYIFAHDAQDFGTDSDESIIKCGTIAANSSETLGFEPQWLLTKKYDGTAGWTLVDSMRRFEVDGSNYVQANTNGSEATNGLWKINSNGFSLGGGSGNYIYVAIRRPHKPAEEFAATELFKTVAGRSDSTSPSYETGFVTDMGIQRRPATTESNLIFSRLTGNKYYDTDNNSDAEATGSSIAWDYMNGALDYFSSAAYRFWGWRRAPGFFDAVAYTGTGSARTISHNLGAVPEMIWMIPRSYAERKVVYNKESGNQTWLDLTATFTGMADSAGAYWNSTTPTESVFSVGNQTRVNASNIDYVAFLFASADGISKIGSYTGTGSSDIDIDCGFSNGARFVLIKCIGGNAAGNHWYLFDSERGIASGNDPYIVLDDTSTSAYGAQDAIDPLSSGFKVRSTAVDGINANGGTYLFYAIA